MSADGFSFLAGTEVLGSQQAGWPFAQSGDGSDRGFRQYVAFQRSFRNPPLVHLGIAGFDIAWRVDVNWLALGS